MNTIGASDATSTDTVHNLPRVNSDGRLTVYSNRRERQRKKDEAKTLRHRMRGIRLLDLPFDILYHILTLVTPSDLIRLLRVDNGLRQLILEHYDALTRNVIKRRYSALEQCFRLPVSLDNVDASLHAALQDERRRPGTSIHEIMYKHIPRLDFKLVCSCLTCRLRWNALCLVVDFAHWQPMLDAYEAIPSVPRGRDEPWNDALLQRHAAIVRRALTDSIWYAVILETHLQSTVRSIQRQASNKTNRRRRFAMTEGDMKEGTDEFLQRKGPQGVDFPFTRDGYYMLEAWLPCRGWAEERGSWVYMPASMHETDLEYVRNSTENRQMLIDAMNRKT